jgi:putative ABC transport system permease protein
VTRFRSDYASESLGALMNYLALQWDGLLIDRRAAAAYNLQVGDQLQARINVGTRPESSFTIVGFLDYFPTSYPEDGLFAVANLDYVFEQLGGRYPYDVWLVTEESVTSEDIWNGLLEIGFNIISVDDSRALVEETQLQPERQGFFGLLSVGFLTTAALTVLGFLLHSYVSFQRRFVHFGMLRALGLSVQQMGLLLAGEQLALIATGLTGGTVVGLTASRLFIPYLQVRAGHHPLTPPYIVQVAWGDVAIVYAIFAVMFFAAAGVLLSLLRRMRIFEAVKLGEAI